MGYDFIEPCETECASAFTPAFSDSATWIMACAQDGQRHPLFPSPLIAWSQSGLIDSGANVRRKSSRPTARPPQLLHVQKTPLDIRISFSGRLHRGQQSSVSICLSHYLRRCLESE